MFQAPKGTRDFLPDEMKRRRWLFDIGRKVFEKYGFGEINTPAFESIDLLTAKDSLGEEAVKDIYRFEDKAGRKLGLRFDPTTPICRILASSQLQKPVKWYYNFYPCWRYEDTKKGRYRELYQSGIEIIGPETGEADAEVLKVVIDFMLSTGIFNFFIRINSRKILDKIAEDIGLDNKEEVFRILDKLDKKGEKEVRKEMSSYLSEKDINKFFARLNAKNTDVSELEKIISLLPVKFRKFVKIDLSIARGLDYYTGFVFETIVKGNEDIGSVASGGRYDNLIGKYGGQQTPATGAGIGVDRILDIMKKEEKQKVDFFVASVSDSTREKAREICDLLREKGYSSEFDMMNRNLSNQLKYASSNAEKVIIVGEKEIKKKKVTIKIMKTGKESRTSLTVFLKKPQI